MNANCCERMNISINFAISVKWVSFLVEWMRRIGKKFEILFAHRMRRGDFPISHCKVEKVEKLSQINDEISSRSSQLNAEWASLKFLGLFRCEKSFFSLLLSVFNDRVKVTQFNIWMWIVVDFRGFSCAINPHDSKCVSKASLLDYWINNRYIVF